MRRKNFVLYSVLVALVAGTFAVASLTTSGAASKAPGPATDYDCINASGIAVSGIQQTAPRCPVGDHSSSWTATNGPTVTTTTTVPATTTTVAPSTTKAPTTTAAPTTTQPVTTTTQPSGHVIFQDQFNSTTLDTTKWANNWLGPSGAITKPVNSEEASCYDPAQVTETGGNLVLSAVARSCLANNGITYQYASGLVNTESTFRFTAGTLTARVWLPGGSSIADWPAVWTAGNPPGSWPSSGESDIMEGSGNACAHYHRSSDQNATAPSDGGGDAFCWPGAFTGWHTVSEVVTPSTTTYLYDGVQVGQTVTVNAAHYIILNLGVKTGAATVPAQMLVDSITVTN